MPPNVSKVMSAHILKNDKKREKKTITVKLCNLKDGLDIFLINLK